jgi:hypothetical protein
MKTDETFYISLSAVQSFRTCQQQYAYRYVERLSRRDRISYLEFGSIIHTYLEIYYQHLKDGETAQDAHEFSKVSTSSLYGPNLKRTAHNYFNLGDIAHAKEFSGMMAKAGRIADRYFLTRGESDAEEYEILYVEEPLEVELRRGYVSRGKVDMITRHNDNGRIHLWEHKSSGRDVPSTAYRLRDLQTLLYADKIRELGLLDEDIDEVMWNYIYTKEPTVPEQLKSGGLTTRTNLDSTWEVYAAELKRLKLNAADYAAQRERLQGREASHYFQRHPQVMLADAEILIGDYLRSARDIKRLSPLWQARKRRPVRTLSISCDFCEYAQLCNAKILSGSDKDARDNYRKREQR